MFVEENNGTLLKRRIFGFPEGIRTKRILNTNLMHWCYIKPLAGKLINLILVEKYHKFYIMKTICIPS